MKILLTSFFLFFFCFLGFSQNTGIGIGTTTPHPSAAFEVKDSSRGFLPPRMTYAQRNAISNPAEGLIIYCIDCDSSGQPQFYDGNKWRNMLGGIAAVTFPDILPSVIIGSQIWQSKNLHVATYRNGDPILQVADPSQWVSLTSGAWCWYNIDSAANAATYGRLYNWYAVADPRGLCPTGWHVPRDAEWETLENQLGGSSVAGGALKSTTGWGGGPNVGATNSSGFSGLPGGQKYYNFQEAGIYGYFWSSSEYFYNSDDALGLFLFGGGTYVSRGNYNKRTGFSVRCLRD